MSEIPTLETTGNQNDSKLNHAIAMIVALCACLMALFNIKSSNIVQAMAQAQAKEIDAWSYYQSKSTKQNLAENGKTMIEMQLKLNTSMNQEVRRKLEESLDQYKNAIDRYEKEKSEIKAQAIGFQEQYERLNLHDDQFDLADALISLALATFGVAALIQNKRLFAFAFAMSVLGAFFGFAGFAQWNIHPEWLTRILG